MRQIPDISKVKRLGAEYRHATGLPLLLVDSEGRGLWSQGGCTLCRRLSVSPKQKKVCRGYLRKAAKESFRWGEPYISVCPFGLVTFAVPI
jgi:ligand-binding sensor protein